MKSINCDRDKWFFRSLKLYSIINIEEISSKEEEDILLDFLKEIICIEMLIRGREYSPNDEFSVRCSWLLGTNERQLEILQKISGTLYALRNFIAHSLFIPSKQKNFKEIFNNDIKKALIMANKLHRLILLRYLLPNGKLICKDDLIKDLKTVKTRLKITVPKSQFANIIAKEVEKITKIKSIKEDNLSISIPEETECLYWGISTYGGLVIKPHIITEMEEFFYEDNVSIIPEETIWNNFIAKIKEEIKRIRKKGYRKLKIISKTHHSVLFFIGYNLLYNAYEQNLKLVIDFNGSEVVVTPLYRYLNWKDYWVIKKCELKGSEKEAILILNVNGYVSSIIEEDLKVLGISQLPKIELNYKCGKEKAKPNRLCFSNGEEIKEACRSLDLFLTTESYIRDVQKIHLFSESRGVMMLLLGMHFRLQKKDVVLYEWGLRHAENHERHYYKVINCMYKRD